MTLTDQRFIVTMAYLTPPGKTTKPSKVNQAGFSIAVKNLQGELAIRLFKRLNVDSNHLGITLNL